MDEQGCGGGDLQGVQCPQEGAKLIRCITLQPDGVVVALALLRNSHTRVRTRRVGLPRELEHGFKSGLVFREDRSVHL